MTSQIIKNSGKQSARSIPLPSLSQCSQYSQ